MKFILRVTGTWFLCLAVVLVIIDGVKTLAASSLTTTSLGEMWSSVHAESWTAVSEGVVGLFAFASGREVAQYLFDWPGWIIFGCAGLLLLVLGRESETRQYQYIASY